MNFIQFDHAKFMTQKEIDYENRPKNIVEKINNLIPSKNNYENYLAHIIKLASAKNIVINNFSIGAGRSDLKTKKLNKSEITFSSSGGFLNFISFFSVILL